MMYVIYTLRENGTWRLFQQKETLDEAREVASNVFQLTKYLGVRIGKEGSQ